MTPQRIEVWINQIPTALNVPAHLSDAILAANVKPPFAAAVNLQFVPKKDHATYRLNAGDKVELIVTDANFRSSQRRTEILGLAERVQALKPQLIAEIGSYQGGTLALFAQAVRGAVAVIGLAIVDQLGRGGAVAFESLGLKVGHMRSADDRPLIPLESEPPQPFEDAADHVGRGAFDVGIFDTKDERAAVAPRVEVIEERSARAADVQVTGGGGSESDARSHASLYFGLSRQRVPDPSGVCLGSTQIGRAHV